MSSYCMFFFLILLWFFCEGGLGQETKIFCHQISKRVFLAFQSSSSSAITLRRRIYVFLFDDLTSDRRNEDFVIPKIKRKRL